MAKQEILDLIFGLLSTCFLLFWRCMANQFPVFPSHYRQFAWADAPVSTSPYFPRYIQKQWTCERKKIKKEWTSEPVKQWNTSSTLSLGRQSFDTSIDLRLASLFYQQSFCLCGKVETFGQRKVFICEYFAHIWNVIIPADFSEWELEGWLQMPWAPKVMPAFEIMQIGSLAKVKNGRSGL